MSDQVYGQDFDAGDEIGPLIKLPDIAQVEAYLQAGQGIRLLSGSRRGENSRMTDSNAANRDGLAGPIIPGPMSQAFLAQLLSDWVGPAGRINFLDVNFRRSVPHGEQIKCIGLITDKHEDGAETVVRIDVFLEDPRGDRPTQGVAEVVIPTRP